MLSQLIRINRNLFFAVEKQLKTAKFAGAISISHLDAKSNSTDKDIITNIEELSSNRLFNNS